MLRSLTLKLSDQDIHSIAHLARLGITREEAQDLTQDLNRIIDWVGLLQAAPTQNVKPIAHPHDESAPLREDSITEQHETEILMANAPHEHDNFFLVPRVL